MRSLRYFLALSLCLAGLVPPALAENFHERLNAIAEGGWAKVNTNSFESAWRLANQSPVPEGNDVVGQPKAIIAAWSSMAWDSRRGDIIIWGGGHANYAGNDVYRWRSSTLRWERASLPSGIVKVYPNTTSSLYETVDGIFNAPIAAHTYDNQEYLHNLDRFITFGGAAYNTGIYWEDRSGLPFSAPGNGKRTGPYMWNPALGHPDRVGGAAGSQANPTLYPNVLAGAMWQNRNNLQSRSNVLTDYPGRLGFINGGSAYHNDQGRDVLYICDFELWRYTIADVNDPAKDLYEKVGLQGEASGQGPGAYDPVRKLFVKIYGGTEGRARNFIFWDLNTAGPTNPARTIALGANTFNLADLEDYGMDFDPVRSRFLLWGGTGDVWSLTPPADPLTQSWTLTPLASSSSSVPARTASVGSGYVLGKWKYAAEYDVFLGLLEPFAGDIWVYKPTGWQPQTNLSADRAAPEVSVTSPAAGASLPTSSIVQVNASDANPILEVKLYAGGRFIATDASAPYQFSLDSATLTPGLVALRAEARDSNNNSALSDAVMVRVGSGGETPPNIAPNVTFGKPATGARLTVGQQVSIEATASDADGSIASVEFFANNVSLGSDTSTPYSVLWTPQAGTYTLIAKATDNAGASAEASVSNVVVSAASGPALSLAFSEPSTITLGQSANLSWSASDVTGCEASGAWDGKKEASGTHVATPESVGEFKYELTCTPSGPGDPVRETVTLNVEAATQVPPDVVSNGGGGGGGCAIKRNAGFDPLLPLLMLIALARRVQRTGSK